MKRIKSLLTFALSSAVFISCGGDDNSGTVTPQQKETYTYSVVVSADFNEGDEIIFPSHKDLYSIYDLAKKFAADETSQNANFKTVSATSIEDADNQAEAAYKSRFEQVRQATYAYAQLLATRLSEFHPNEYQSLTAKLNGVLHVKLNRTGSETMTKIDQRYEGVLSFNKDKQLVPYEIKLMRSSNAAFDKSATPTFCQAFEAAEKAMQESLDAALKNAGEGNGTKAEFFCVQANDEEFDKLDALHNKYMTLREKAAERWAETAGNIFWDKFGQFEIPAEEMAKIDEFYTFELKVLRPYKYCPECEDAYSLSASYPHSDKNGCPNANMVDYYGDEILANIEIVLK